MSQQPRGARFWLIFLSVCVTAFLSALELSSISTALPTISHDLGLNDTFVWVGNAYTMAATAFLPLSGGLAQVWGRRNVMIGFLVLFAVGSALAGSAKGGEGIILGRTIQGIGGGGIPCLADIIVADLVPLNQRGPYIGIVTMAWVIAAAIGPLIGGVFSGKVTWRWLFYLNLPLVGIAMALCLLFLRLRMPRLSLREKFARMDWVGNLFIISATASAVIALTWAGDKYPWRSYEVLIPFLLGWVLLGAALWYEGRVAKEPTVPFELFKDKTGVSGYINQLFHAVISTAVIYYLPVYFQAVHMLSPWDSSLETLGLALTYAPSAIIVGFSATIIGRYLPQTILGWILITLGTSLLSTLTLTSPKSHWVIYEILTGTGLGMVAGVSSFPVLASQDVREGKTAYALALWNFVRGFAQTWGITIGTAVVQNELVKRVPSDVVAQLDSLLDPTQPTSTLSTLSLIPLIPLLPPSSPQQTILRQAFVDSLSELWKIMAGFGAAGLLVTLCLMREVPMTSERDENWGMEDERGRENDTSALVGVGGAPTPRVDVEKSTHGGVPAS